MMVIDFFAALFWIPLGFLVALIGMITGGDEPPAEIDDDDKRTI